MRTQISSDKILIEFEAPTTPLSENQSRTMHWGARNRRLHPWRDVILEAWEDLSKTDGIEDLIGVYGEVQLYLPFDRTERQWAADRRDPHNYVSTVCKTVVDAITDKRRGKTVIESRLWPDDTPEWVKVLEPILVRGTEATVEITFGERS